MLNYLTDQSLNTKSDDKNLIDAFLKGDQNAFNLLIRKYQEGIYRVIRKMVLDHDDADDLTQEVFIKIYNSVNEFRGESKFFTYIYRIAVNLSLNFLNKNKRNYSRNVSLSGNEVSSSDLKADEIIDATNRTVLLEKAIESLPAQQRAVFNLRYYENLSYEEISSVMEKSTGGMKANYFHALKNLQKFLISNKMFELMDTK